MFTASKASIPKIDVGGPMVKYKGTTMRLTGDYKKDPFPITFWNERGWEARTFFEDWLALFAQYNSLENKRLIMEEGRFQGKLNIKQIGNHQSDILAEYELFDAIPMELSEIELDHASIDTAEEFQVVFEYSFFERIS